MAEKKKYNSILVSGRKDETLTYSRYVKDEESGESVKESLDKKVNTTDKLETQQIKDGAITNEKLAADSVGNTNMQDGSVSNEKLEDGSITNEKLAENSITKDKLKDNTIGVEKLDPELRQTINAATGLPENLLETIQNVDDTLKDHQSQLEDKQQQITANDEDISLLQTRSTQMEEIIKSIAATGGASQATAVTYNNEKSKLTAVNIQSAVDEVVDKASIKDEEGTIVETPFRYIQNEEFIFAKVDAEDKLLFGIQLDGTPKFAKTSAVEDRLQSQVNLLADKITTILGDDDMTSAIDTLKELKDFFANIDNTQTLTSILANLNSVSTKLGEDIKKLQDTKVDKEEGKSLIDDEVKECFKVIENEEFIKAITDADDKVLFGIYRESGKPYFPLNEMYHVEQNEEFFAVWLDAANHVILGIRRDGQIIGEIHAVNALKQVISQLQSDLVSLQEKVGTIDTNLKELLDVFSLQENPEYLAVEKDADGKVLSATYNDGSHYIHNAKSETIPEEFSHIEDQEGRTEITTDADGKVMSYRDSSGKKHEHDMEVTNLDVSNINLQGNSVNNIQDALKANGFDIKGKTDWSDWYDKHDSALELPIPTKAVINITGVNQMPSKKLVNDKAYIEFFDFAGNYFKIKAYLNAQGSSTMHDPMKSCAIDLFSDDWGGNEFEIKFGDWVAQDGFHLKAFYKDSLKSIQPICYEIGEQITSFLNVRSNRFHISSDNVLIGGTGDMEDDVSQAKCMPSQFPCEVYLNGEYYGLFIWSLKKNRKNYSMNKKDNTSILIDNVGGMFNGDSFNWISAEIRNPKKLICVDGEEYDADTHMGELIGTDTVAGQQYTFSKLNAATTGTDTFKVTSVDYNAANKDMVNSAKTKAIIEACQAYKSEVNSASTNEEKKKIVEKSFDIDNLLAYIIFCELTYNQDGWYNNAQITIYDKKVGYNIYDCDSCLGKAWNGILWTSSLSREIFDSNSTNPLFVIKSLYAEEIGTMYKTLRDKGIITKENLNKIVDDWFDRLGTDALKRSVTKWNNSPSYRKPTNLDEHWKPYIPLSKSELESINSYNAETNYSVGTIVCYGNGGYDNYYYKCVKECLGSTPTTDGNYYTNGMYDSKERIKMWLEKRIDFCDVLWNYK